MLSSTLGATSSSPLSAGHGWSPRLEAFERWMADAHPAARISITELGYLTFGPLAEIVFDPYDVILRIRFPSETVAQEFEAR
jgi:hypothetical protein